MACHQSKMPAEGLIPLRSSFRFDYLKHVIACPLEKNKEAVRIILDSKKEIRKNPELLLLIKDYCDKGLHTLNFCTALHTCHENAQKSQLFLQRALLHLNESDPSLKYEKAKDDLQLFKESVYLFAKKLPEDFQLVHQQQLSLLETLRIKKKRLDEKLKSLEAWKKRLLITFVSASAFLLIFWIVTPIVGARPIAEAIFAACSAMGAQFNSMWNNYMEAFKREKMILSALKAGASAAINEMDGIHAMVKLLKDQISFLLENDAFNFRDEGVVTFLTEEIGKKLELFVNNMEDLVLQADQCRRDIKQGRTGVYRAFAS